MPKNMHSPRRTWLTLERGAPGVATGPAKRPGALREIRGGGKIVSKVSVVLDEQEQIELQIILTDEDGAAALHFLKEVVWARIQAVRRKGLRSHLEKGLG